MSKPLEFTVRVKVTVQPEDWADEYGLPGTAREVRADARQHITSVVDDMMQTCFPLGYLLTKVEVS